MTKETLALIERDLQINVQRLCRDVVRTASLRPVVEALEQLRPKPSRDLSALLNMPGAE